MALEATHIKFALDLKEKYQVEDLQKYISGSIYPDSRYISRIPREKTHFNGLLSPLFFDTDFKKGWSSHFLCDKVQGDAMNELFSDIIDVTTSQKVYGSDWWITISSLKVIQDILICRDFDVQPYLPLLEYVETPNEESVEKVKEFNKIIQDTYFNKKSFTLDDAVEMWLKFGVGEEIENRMKKTCEQYLNNPDIMRRIDLLYEKMIGLSFEYINFT